MLLGAIWISIIESHSMNQILQLDSIGNGLPKYNSIFFSCLGVHRKCFHQRRRSASVEGLGAIKQEGEVVKGDGIGSNERQTVEND